MSVRAAWIRRQMVLTAMVLLSGWMGGCSKDGADDPSMIGTRLVAAADPPAWELIETGEAPTSMTLRLRWPAGAPAPDTPEPLVFCLPPDREISARWLEARVGERLLGNQARDRSSDSRPTPAEGFLAQAPRVEPAGWLRQWPLYRLHLQPGAIDLLRGREHVDQPLELTLGLNWDQAFEPAEQVAAPATAAERDWRVLAEALVLNREGLERYRAQEPPLPPDLAVVATDPRRLAGGERPWARLRIEREGLYRLHRDDLLRAGFGSGRDLAAARVFSRGRPVPLLRVAAGDADGLEPGVYFWAAAGDGPYSRERVYWLTLGDDLPDPILEPQSADEAAAPPERALVSRRMVRDRDEQRVELHGQHLAIAAIRWIESPLERGEDHLFSLELPDWTHGELPIRARLDFLIDREKAHLQPRVEVHALPRQLGIMPIPTGGSEASVVVEIPPAVIRDGHTTLSLRLIQNPSLSPAEIHQGSGVWLDRIVVDYPGQARLEQGRLTLAEEDSGPAASWIPIQGPAPTLALAMMEELPVQRLPLIRREGRLGVERPASVGRVELLNAEAILAVPRPEAAAPVDLADPELAADLLVIYHRRFEGSARRLANHHEAGGRRVLLAEIQQVYDSFSHGELTPFAIRALLAHALRHWQSAPAQVLLVGDCNSDYLNIARDGVANDVPSYSFGDGAETWASDWWLGTVAGGDDMADYMIGRLSAVEPSDMEAIVDKSLAYQGRPPAGPWRARVGYVADRADLGREFTEAIDDLRLQLTPAAFAPRRTALDELPLEDNWYLPRDLVEAKSMKVSRAATESIETTLRNGVVMLDYYGHGSPNIWSNDRIWFGGGSRNSDNPRLAGSGFPSFIVNMTCNSGAIDYPLRPWNICISEDLLRTRDGGAVGLFVPSGPGTTMGHRELSAELRAAMFRDRLRGLGEVTTLAKLRLAVAGRSRDLVYMHLLLGDPLLRLAMPAEWFSLELTPAVVEAGAERKLVVKADPLREGRWVAELIEERGRLLWSDEGLVERGRISLAPRVPPETAPGPLRLSVYAWDEEGRERAIAGELRVEAPRLELAGMRIEEPLDRVQVEVFNPGVLTADGVLELLAGDGVTSSTVERIELRLEGGERRQLQRSLPAAPGTGPVRLEARLTPSHPPVDSARPASSSLIRYYGVPDGWQGWLPGSATVQVDMRGVEVTMRALARLEAGRGSARLLTKAGIELSSATLSTHPAQPSLLELTARLGRAQWELLADGQLELVETPVRDQPGQRVDRLALQEVPAQRARLRLIPESVRHYPDRPTEGETVFIEAMVENIGNATSEPWAVELLDDGMAGATVTKEFIPGSARRELPRLAPGRAWPVTLRHDPFNNAGLRRLQVRLAPMYGPGGEEGWDQVELAVEALSRPKLRVVRTWAEATPGDQRANRLHLLAELANDGQTDAHGVSVMFYRSPVQSTETELGEVEIERVEAGGTATARLTWNYEPGRDFVAGGEPPRPSVLYGLKYSAHRASSEAPAGGPP